MYNRNRLSPISLTGEYPVTQLIIYLAVTNTLLCQEIFYLFLGFFNTQSCQETGIDHLTGCHIGKGCLINIHRAFLPLYNLNHRKTKFLGKFPVTVIMGRYRHNGTGSVCHQYIIGNPDRNFRIINRINGCQPAENHTGFILSKLCTLKIRLFGSHIPVCHNLIPVGNLILVFINDRMLRRNYHVSSTKQGIRSCGIYP